MHGWILKAFGTLLAKSMPTITKKIVEEIAHRFMPVEKYCFEDNELDISVKEMKKEFDSMKFKVNAQRDLFKDIQNQIDKIQKIAHPPAIDLKEFEDMKETIRLIKNKKVFKSLNAK